MTDEKEAARQQRIHAALTVIGQIDAGRNVQPKTKTAKGPAPEPRGLIAPLGGRPQELARLIDGAARLLRQAEGLAFEILGMSKKGIQQAEPRSLLAFLGAVAGRCEAMVPRASAILNEQGGAE